MGGAARELAAVRPQPARTSATTCPTFPSFARCGFAVTVPHAPPSVRARAHFVTMRDGGKGAVRELCELILAAQGKLPDADVARPVPGVLPR